MCKVDSVAKPSESASSAYVSIGNFGYFATLVSSALFALMVVSYAANPSSNFLFDDEWKQEGFCVTNRKVEYWNSHDVCLYADLFCAPILLLLYLVFRKTPGLERASKMIQANVVGVALHGMGHGQVGAVYRQQVEETVRELRVSIPERLANDGIVTVAGQEALGLAFWLGLLFASMPESSKKLIAGLAVVTQLCQGMLPVHFGFTYVQSVLMLANCLDQLNLPSKEKAQFWYATNPWMVGLPVTLIGWMESTNCTAFVRDNLYGHVVYDGYICVSLMVWYITCIIQAKQSSGGTKVKTM